VDPDRMYCYVVRVHGDTPLHTSLSNKVCLPTDYPNVPQWNYLRVATVEAEGHVVVIDSVDLSATARRYHLERTFNGEPWEEIASAPGGISPTVVFNDLDVLTQERSYTYRVVVDDSCGVMALTSNVGTSILLLAESRLDGTNHLRWNGYVQWAGLVNGYTIYRSLDNGPFTPIAINPPAQWDYTDDVRAFTAGNGLFCYYVEANEAGNPSAIEAVSTSNAACAVQQEEVWIPNAFIASGINNSFKPILAYADVREYELTLFNRWGQSIWTTNDPDEAWDGRMDGDFVPQGVYAYFCAFQNGAGKKFERRGTVTFIAGLE
jgi:gliding motility-associated-like protein